MNRANTRTKEAAKPILHGVLLAASFVLASASAEANSLAISDFKGHWRPDAQLCSGFQDEEAAVSFGVENGRNSYIQFDKLKCAVQAGRDLSVHVADAKSCVKSGFPTRFIGEYSVILVGQYVVKGYLAFSDSNGDASIMKDCGALRWWGTQK